MSTGHSVEEVTGYRDRYNSRAKNIALSGKFDNTGTDHPALYSFFLAFFYFLFGYNVYSFLIPQIILSSISAVLVFHLTEHLFKNTKVSLGAGIFFALNPHFILLSIQLYSETLYFFLLLSIFLLAGKLLSVPRAKNALILGVLAGLAALCRSVFLIFLPFIFIWTITVSFLQKKKSSMITPGFFLSFSLIFSLSIIINPLIFARFSVYRVLSTGARDSVLEGYEKEIHQYVKNYWGRDYGISIWIKDNPEKYLNLCKGRAKIFLFQAYRKGVSLRHKIISGLIFYTIFPLGYLGIIIEIIKKRKLSWLILLYVFSTTILHIMVSVDGEIRYRLPIELLMGIFACQGISFIISQWKKITVLR